MVESSPELDLITLLTRIIQIHAEQAPEHWLWDRVISCDVPRLAGHLSDAGFRLLISTVNEHHAKSAHVLGSRVEQQGGRLMGSMDQAMHEEFAARTMGQTFRLVQSKWMPNVWLKIRETASTNARPAEGDEYVDPEQNGPYRIIARFALCLPEVRRLPGGLAWFESGPAVVNRFARIEVRSPFGALVRDQWSYV